MLIRLQQRRGTEAQWTSADPVLSAGEIAFSTDDQTFRIGDGVTAWSSLPYFQNSTDIEAAGLVLLATANTYTDGAVGVASTNLTTAIGAAQTAANTYTDGKIAALVDSAPETLDTLGEIATLLQNNDGDITSILSVLGTKSDIGHTHTIDELSDVDTSGVAEDYVLYYDSSTQTWKPKELLGIENLTVSTTAQSGSGSLTYNSSTGEFTFAPPVTGVTAGSFSVLEATGPFAASTGGYHTYNDGSQDLAVTITTTVSYVNLVSISADHQCSSYAAAKLVRVVDSVETEIFNWSLLTTKDFSWTIYDEHNLEPGTTITYLLKGQGTSATSYIGQNYDVQMWVQEVAGALGGQPTSPDITVETATEGNSTGGLTYTDGTLTYTPVLPAAAALSELTDVDLTDLADTDVLAYDAASGTWLPGSAASSMAQLTDVHLQDAAEGDTLLYAGAANGWVTVEFPTDVAPSLVSFVSVTADYSIVDTDKDKMLEVSSSTPVTITIPTEATLSVPIGTTITIMQVGTGQVTIEGADSVAVFFTPSNVTRTQYSSATLIKRDSNIWYLMGDLA